MTTDGPTTDGPSTDEPSSTGRVKVRWVKSMIGYNRKQRATLRGLGLRRLNQTVEREDTPCIRGMINAVTHLVVVVEDT